MERKRTLPGKFFGQILSELREPQPYFASKKEAKDYLHDQITKRRNAFIQEYKQGFHGNSVLTYEPALDREVYKTLQKYKHTHEDAYEEVLRGLSRYTKDQVETFIGERLNVGLSKFQYDLDEYGVMYGQGMNESLLDMIKRGQETRDIVSDAIDYPRQEAEVTQFEKIQQVMGDPNTKIGTTILSFSPPGKEGSAYAHNFYDVFILRGEEKGKRYVEARRYASGLSLEESLQHAEKLVPGFTKEVTGNTPLDAYFISRPLVLSGSHEYFNKPDELHKILQGDPKAMSYDDFQKKVVKDPLFSEMLTHYLSTLEDDPNNTVLLNRTLNALMNRADEIVELRKPVFIPQTRRDTNTNRRLMPIAAQINNYGMQQVRQTTTGCGSSGGIGEKYGSSRMPSNMSPMKASDVASGEDALGKRTFECPECHQTNLRPYNDTIKTCQHCGSPKVAC